jgi:hypothetical protein
MYSVSVCVTECTLPDVLLIKQQFVLTQTSHKTQIPALLRQFSSCKRASLSVGALLGNLKGVGLLGLLREMNSISEYLSWTWRLFRF